MLLPTLIQRLQQQHAGQHRLIMRYKCGYACTKSRTAISHYRSIGVMAAAPNDANVAGRAVREDYESSRQRGKPVYDIEVVAAGNVFDVAVDASNGIVRSFAIDKTDSDDQHDPEV